MTRRRKLGRGPGNINEEQTRETTKSQTVNMGKRLRTKVGREGV
jgi:hypothetical protein